MDMKEMGEVLEEELSGVYTERWEHIGGNIVAVLSLIGGAALGFYGGAWSLLWLTSALFLIYPLAADHMVWADRYSVANSVEDLPEDLDEDPDEDFDTWFAFDLSRLLHAEQWALAHISHNVSARLMPSVGALGMIVGQFGQREDALIGLGCAALVIALRYRAFIEHMRSQRFRIDRVSPMNSMLIELKDET